MAKIMLYWVKSCHSRPGGVKGASNSHGRIGKKANRYSSTERRPRKFLPSSSRKIARICLNHNPHGGEPLVAGIMSKVELLINKPATSDYAMPPSEPIRY